MMLTFKIPDIKTLLKILGKAHQQSESCNIPFDERVFRMHLHKYLGVFSNWHSPNINWKSVETSHSGINVRVKKFEIPLSATVLFVDHL